MEKENTYTVKRHCSNCGHVWVDRIKKGEEVSPTVICPNCECYTGH